MAKQPQAEATTAVIPAAVPNHLAQYAGQKQKIGNVDSSDRIIPRIKLIQAISPEIQEHEGVAKNGQFWHTIAQENLGPTILGIPIIVQKAYMLWAPRGDDRGILARARDGVHWDPANAEFTVKPKGSPSPITYKTAETVAESGLAEFGTSIPGDPNSAPAASLTYTMMWYLPEHPELSPSLIINTRSSVKPMQQLLSRIDSKPVPHFCQLYEIGSTQQKGAEGPYFNYTYSGRGFADKDLADLCCSMYEQFSKGGWVASDESEEEDLASKPARQVDEKVAGKF